MANHRLALVAASYSDECRRQEAAVNKKTAQGETAGRC